jgi:hypothetical protein
MFAYPSLSVLFAGLLTMCVLSSPARAQATRTWVSGVGDDANPCSRTAPCKTFAGAISKTVASGEINCLDPGGFGALTITKAISVACESLEAGVLVGGTNGIVVSAGAADTVVLRGLDFVGVGTGFDGILFNSGAALHVENCVIRGFLGSPGNGIHFAPTASSKLFVSNTTVTNNNAGAASAGVLVRPVAGGVASGVIEGVQLLNNGNGLIVDGTATTATAQMSIVLRNSNASGNGSNGVSAVAAAGRPPVEIIVDRSIVQGNNSGVSSVGSGADITLGYSVVTGNNLGVTFTAPAQLRSYSTNQLRANLANGSPSGTIPLE